MSLGLLEDIKIQLRCVRSALTTAKSQSGRRNIVLRDVCFGFGVLVPPPQWIPVKLLLTQMCVIIHHVDRNVCAPVFYKADFVSCF